MIARDELLDYCSGLLSVNSFKDYCPNGLQVEGADKIECIVAGVTANQALIEAAIARGADTLLVHHGYFWRGEDPVVRGMKRTRLGLLLQHNINLIAYHLPLDAHAIYGNNAGLGQALGFASAQPVEGFAEAGLLWHAELDEAVSASALQQRLTDKLMREPLYIAGGSGAGGAGNIRRVAWCTGGAQQFISAAADSGADAYITGEVSEQTVHIARERGIHFYAAGHHATERFGAQALANHLGERFSLQTTFVDIPNPA